MSGVERGRREGLGGRCVKTGVYFSLCYCDIDFSINSVNFPESSDLMVGE